MKVLLAGIVATIVLAIAVGLFVPRLSEYSWQVLTTQGARVDDPGTNLVGPGWTGENQPAASGEEIATGEESPG